MSAQAPHPIILIVDDLPENLTVLSELLQPYYDVRVATSGEKALRVAHIKPYPDLILLDVMMPGMDGYQVFEQLRADPSTHDIPVIFVTAMDSKEAELHGLNVGAVDYITKPVVPPIVLARIHTQLELKQAREYLANQNAWLETEVTRRMMENELIQEVSIRALAHLAEIRDSETGYHILRTQAYVEQLALGLQKNPDYADALTNVYIKLLTRSAPLHDIGKVGIPDAILQKPGPLTPQEWVIMKTHAQLGSDAIDFAERDAAEPVEFLSLAKEIARWHHEKWDGSGYPDGLIGDATPISARIMALADVFDALISPRVYKLPMPYEEAKDIILNGRGTHFDPDVVDIFISQFDVFCKIADRYRDSHSDS
ncbi:MAG: two-component system response regulator [Methylicorpusculum sp.]|uniref:response regulator n=1 Tax=Methylicorpusculum sp. TaxID=2713644 RepID=UPI00271694F2|nr:two-component system response regulator [Methylicorpusculum sp.]MDO8939686.1 two-component system response regulator [Methylicorpusculum sp.]MDP2202878.1 two-component system response regulator [Methylicorpusculum sp.]